MNVAFLLCGVSSSYPVRSPFVRVFHVALPIQLTRASVRLSVLNRLYDRTLSVPGTSSRYEYQVSGTSTTFLPNGYLVRTPYVQWHSISLPRITSSLRSAWYLVQAGTSTTGTGTVVAEQYHSVAGTSYEYEYQVQVPGTITRYEYQVLIKVRVQAR